MSCNTFGRFFRVTTFGESHGPALGVVIDGLPPALSLDLCAIQHELHRRRPGQSTLSSPRQESDKLEILSGLFEGQTTGAPLCLMVTNHDARPQSYEALRQVFRPGHADFTMQQKYGLRDWRGGGRASGRETVARVAAGAVARQLLGAWGVEVLGHVVELGGIEAVTFDPNAIEQNPVRCADAEAALRMIKSIEQARQAGDSVGGIVEVRARGVPAGWGDPVFGKLDALLAGALMGIGAVKGVEIGDGFALTRRRGSQTNDALGPTGFATNHAGGILGGISSGQEIVARLAVKPTPSIAAPQQTIDHAGQSMELRIEGRHDPCIAPRLVPVAEAMVALVLVDARLSQRALVG
jgi:chorismate synthase